MTSHPSAYNSSSHQYVDDQLSTMAELATTNTEWPAIPVPETLKKLMDHFFVIMDKNTPGAGARLAAEVFTPEATFILSGGTYVGTEEIKVSRIEAWKVVASRDHKIRKVYTCNDDASDLLFIGRAKMTLINGKYIEGDFIGRAIYQNFNSPDVKMKHFQVWGDSGPVIRALQDN